jgi:glycosyltransferase involved in cell wall biosynthesis
MDAPVKIAHVIGSLLEPLGGAEQYVVELARTQASAGHDVTVVTGWASPPVAGRLLAAGVVVEVVQVRRPYPPDRRGSRPAALLFHGLDLLDSIRTPRALRRVLARDWDVVHAHRVAGLGAALLRSTAAPVVVTVHDYSLVDTNATLLRRGRIASRPPLVQRLRTRVMSRAIAGATMVFPNDALAGRHAAWGLEIPPGSVVVPHGWRLPGSAGASRGTGTPVVFLFLGKLVPSKGVHLLLDAWGQGIPGAELWIAGAGPLEREVAAAAARGRIRNLGWLDPEARSAALAAADAMVLPSVWPEIFLLSAAEGVLAGLPVISTTAARPPVVRHGETGVLTEPDPAALRAAMLRLLDPVERSRFARGTGALAAELDFEHHSRRIEELYTAVRPTCEVAR